MYSRKNKNKYSLNSIHSIVQNKTKGIILQDNRAIAKSQAILQRKCEKCGEEDKEEVVQNKVVQRVGYASEATCESIKEAYPILGTKAERQYAKINHAPATDKERVNTYRARVNVMKFFRQAHLCNGVNGAPKSVRDSFLSGEDGHIMAANNVRASITNARKRNALPADCESGVKGVTIRKQQCK